MLLLREGIHLAESIAAPLEALDLRGQLLAVLAFRGVGSSFLEPPPRLGRFRLEAGPLDVDGRSALACFGRCAPGLGFLGTEPPELRRKLTRTRGARVDASLERRLEPPSSLARPRERRGQALREDGQGLEGDRSAFLRAGLLGLSLELLGLPCQGAPPGVELQQHRLGRLAGETQLAAVGVVAVALARDEDSVLRAREVCGLREPDVRKQLGHPFAARRCVNPTRERLCPGERRPPGMLWRLRRQQHRQVAETARAHALDEGERTGDVRGDCRGRAACQCRGHRSLVARLDLERGQRQLLPLLGERPRCWRQAFQLCERVLQRREPLARQARLLPQALALRVAPPPREQGLGAQALCELDRSLAPQLEALRSALQPVERGGRALALPRSSRKLVLDAVPLGEQRLHAFVDALTLERGRRRALVDLREPFLDLCEVELGEPGPQAADLAAKLLGPLGRARLERQRPEPGLDLGFEIACALDLGLHADQLELGPVPPPLELPEAGGVLDQDAPFLGLAREDLLDLALPDNRAVAAAEADVREQLDEIRAPHGRAVHEVLPLAPAVQPPRDRDLAELEVLHRAVLVVEQQLDLAVVRRLSAAGRAGEEDVVRLLGTQLVRAQAAGGPEHRVGDVRLSGAVRTDHDRHARLEPNLDGIREGLEAADADRTQVHARRTLATCADAATEAGANRLPVHGDARSDAWCERRCWPPALGDEPDLGLALDACTLHDVPQSVRRDEGPGNFGGLEVVPYGDVVRVVDQLKRGCAQYTHGAALPIELVVHLPPSLVIGDVHAHKQANHHNLPFGDDALTLRRV